jgi:hypothetical protein
MACRFQSRRRFFESLEPRHLLAGNVTAALVGADLVITGDTEANVISLVETENDGEFVILAESDSSGAATTLNGTSNGVATIGGVIGNIVIYLHGGDDSVAIADINHSGNLTADMAAGNDTVSVARAVLDGTITVKVGDGQNVVTLAGLDVGGSLVVESPSSETGDNRSIPNTYSLSDSSIGVDARLALGVRAGSVGVRNCSIGRNLQINNGFEGVAGSFRLSDTYAGMRLNDLIVRSEIEIETSASSLVAINNVFGGSTFFLWGHAHFNDFQIRNSRFVGESAITTLASNRTLGGRFGDHESAYDNLLVTGLVADSGLYTQTSGDLYMAYSYFGGNSTVRSNRMDDTLKLDTNLYAASVDVFVGSGTDHIEFKNSVVNGNLIIKHNKWVATGPVDPAQRRNADGSSVMIFANNRIGTLDITGGSQTDDVRILHSVVDQLLVDLDFLSSNDLGVGGSDLLEIAGTVANKGARLDGDAGFDLFRGARNTFNGLALLNFEAF